MLAVCNALTRAPVEGVPEHRPVHSHCCAISAGVISIGRPTFPNFPYRRITCLCRQWHDPAFNTCFRNTACQLDTAGRISPAWESPLLAGLNPAQREAVTHVGGPLLVVAGAGSGKTRVLTHRIAHLIEARGLSPYGILAITFTNKAADEMKRRVGVLVGSVVTHMWVSTFHSACVKILRREADRIGYPSQFTIYDQRRRCPSVPLRAQRP